MSELIRICDEVRCPYSSTQGCTRYTVSPRCHLAYSDSGVVRQGFWIKASQYWLYADDAYDRVETENLQAAFLARPEEIQRAKMEGKLQSKPESVTWRN
jgi:hypothetical protein